MPKREIRSAGITQVQRFGGALNLSVHLHGVECDGVFVLPTAGPAERR